MSSHHKKYRPYIRRQHPADRADDFSTALRLALFQENGWRGWVLVQHGVRGKVVEIARSRGELIHSMVGADEGFQAWARRVQAFGPLVG
ncbi:hypothetical protein TK90_2617 (plasmid) [Thioalkalivibrio sp. K90mix]|uniref:hypothetical protein n=1 Tax=Thioalkalivibrio sp. (strain K90mix) TaxID=396595 RepID=UPI000195AB23|nr:hypothetical protein [Thioalkalivibrio sp. K90mix]ADC73104.1 hypothetical protein TK90_2617 [Thioalkalivibrio sp. K90mix]